ncbi:MAG: photosynthetic complex assembly protein PuhC [Hyphomonadaceae bacterium]|nr:photosynthetic complex assembly protein PuhC [Hyphomonadaceae bacterium]
MSNIDTKPFPRIALIAGALLMGGSITAAAVARYGQSNLAESGIVETAKPVAARDLVFFDMENGAVEVRESGGERVVFVAEPGTNGFIRGVMRGMARNRHAHGLGQEEAFRLAQWQNGRLSLEDLATGKVIELGAFGAENRKAFAQLLSAAVGGTT